MGGPSRSQLHRRVDTIREFMRRGVIIKTVINGMTFDGSTTDPMQQAVRDALIAFMAATAQAQADATKSAQRAGIDHKRRAQAARTWGRKPSYDRATFDRIRLALNSASPPSLSAIAKAERLSKQTVFRSKQDPRLRWKRGACGGCSFNGSLLHMSLLLSIL